MKATWCLLLGLLLVFERVNGITHCDAPDDIDVAELASSSILATGSNQLVSEDEVRTEMAKELANNQALREMVEQVSSDQEADSPIAKDIIRQTGIEPVDAQLNLAVQSYYHTCPYRYWWLLPYKWYFVSEDANGLSYHWAFWPWWYTSCGQRYCNVSFRIPWYWYHYHRCFPEYRRVWFWALRLRIAANGQNVWTSELIFRYVPRGCCCRRFWRTITALQCPA